jgi:hypothetical protein
MGKMEIIKRQIAQVTFFVSDIILALGFWFTYRIDDPIFYDFLIIIFIPIGFLILIIRLIRDTEPRWGIHGTIVFSLFFSIFAIAWGIVMDKQSILPSTMTYGYIIISGLIGLLINIIGIALISENLRKLFGIKFVEKNG